MNPTTRDPDEPLNRTGIPGDPGSPPADDPGGAHAKGYSADATPGAANVCEPIPIVDAPVGGIHVPERDDGVQPTGRHEIPDEPDNRVVSGG